MSSCKRPGRSRIFLRCLAVDVGVVWPLETIAFEALVEEELDAEAQRSEAALAQLILEHCLPPSRLVLVSGPALPAIEGGELVMDGERDAAALEVIDHVATPNRDIRHVEE